MEKNSIQQKQYLSDDFNMEAYNNGLKLLFEIHNDFIHLEQTGGANSAKKNSKILAKVFSPRNKEAFTRAIRGIIRTSGGVSADILTVGAGGDIVVNSVFAIESSMSFIGNAVSLVKSLEGARELFSKLFRVDPSKKIPLVSRLNLDDGLQTFESEFENILAVYLNKYGTNLLDDAYQSILNIINKITTTVSDWIACLFPDTAGLAGEITKTILDYIALNGYSYTYNLISILPDNMQKMITNSFALKKLIRHSVKFLRNLLENMSPQQIAEIVQSLGVKAADFVSNPLLKGTIRVGTEIASEIALVGLKSAKIASSSTLSFLPKAQSIMIYIIDKYITPNIDKGVDLFNQLFPLYLMFTLFIEKYPLIASGQIVPRKLTTTGTDYVLANKRRTETGKRIKKKQLISIK